MTVTTSGGEQINNHAGFIWSVADLLRGDYKQSEYGKVILPLTVLRRLDCVLEPTKAAVLARAEKLERPGREHRAGALLSRRPAASTTPRRSTSAGCSTTPPSWPATSAATSPASPRGPGGPREVRLRHPDHPAGQGRPALPGGLAASPTSTSTQTRSPTSRWATSTRS